MTVHSLAGDQHPQSVLDILRHYRSAYMRVFFHSVFIALLALSPFLYLMQVHERVYLSRSWETLGFITLIIAIMMAAWGILSWARQSALNAVGLEIDTRLRELVFIAIHSHPGANATQYLTDVGRFREGLTGTFIASAFDSILSPLFIAVLFLLHPAFGWTCLVFLAIVGGLSYLNSRIWRQVRDEEDRARARGFNFGLSTSRSADTIVSMNMLGGITRKWMALTRTAPGDAMPARENATRMDAVLSLLRRSELVIIIGVGAVLYLANEISAGIAFAAFIVMMRGVNPVLNVVQNWKVVGETIKAYDNLDTLIRTTQPPRRSHLPALNGRVTCAGLTWYGGRKDPILRGISFDLAAGASLGIIGPNGAGKSSLLALLAGRHVPYAGEIRIDGYPRDQWPIDQIGAASGYLPQSVDLFPGTIWENVARFNTYDDDSNAKVLEAIELAAASDIIKALPDGLNTALGHDGTPLSGGQKQKIGLARALWGNPKLLILDEPNAALDAAGERQLLETLRLLRRRGTTLILTTHKPGLLDMCDQLLILKDGIVQALGARDDILDRIASAGRTNLVGSAAG